MLINLAILAALVVPSIMAARLSREEMADALIKVEKEDLEKTFKKFKEEQDLDTLSYALADVASIQEHMPKVATCLRTVVDPFPKEMSRTSELVNYTVGVISNNTENDAESFAKVIASFEPSDVKPLASIRYWTFRRDDAVKALESVLKKSPELITGSLSRWLANHSFDQNSDYYTTFGTAREQAFRYLTFFATERVLNDALAIVKANQHYQLKFLVYCCDSHDSFPHDLVTKLERLLAIVKARNAHINEALVFLPTVLADMVADYLPTSTN